MGRRPVLIKALAQRNLIDLTTLNIEESTERGISQWPMRFCALEFGLGLALA